MRESLQQERGSAVGHGGTAWDSGDGVALAAPALGCLACPKHALPSPHSEH